MRKTIIVFCGFIGLSVFMGLKSEDNNGTAKVSKIEGKEVYLFSEPLRAYKVVKDYDNSTNLIPTCNLMNLVDSYLKNAKRDKLNYDALYMNVNENIYLIKFIKE